MESKIYKKIESNKIIIARRLDLHGYSLEQSFDLLLNFLHQAYKDNLRYVLIIVGKGVNNQGVLQINVPRWLRTVPNMAKYVSAVTHAAPKHGGKGALYVRLKKSLS